MRLLRRRADARVQEATALHAAGDFVRARELALEIVEDGDPSLEVLRGLAELEYLLGDYASAEPRLRQVVAMAGGAVAGGGAAEVALALVYLQTNRFAESAGLFAGAEVELPIWELMTSFGEVPPYRLDWSGAAEASLSFVQTTTWELPCVRIEVDGSEVEARVDTG